MLFSIVFNLCLLICFAEAALEGTTFVHYMQKTAERSYRWRFSIKAKYILTLAPSHETAIELRKLFYILLYLFKNEIHIKIRISSISTSCIIINWD